ncbi:MAG: type II toxin-antitoxin system HicA family toxin [Patescibacteria group bacterium]
MPKPPLWHYKKVIKVLGEFGYVKARQKGSHIRLSNPDRDSVTIPAHNPVARGTLRKILRDADLTIEKFLGGRE